MTENKEHEEEVGVHARRETEKLVFIIIDSCSYVGYCA